MLVVTPRPCEERNDRGKISAKHENQRSRFQRGLCMRLEFVEQRDDFRKITGALVLLVVGKVPFFAIAQIRNFVTSGGKLLDKSRCAERGGGFLGSRCKGGS